MNSESDHVSYSSKSSRLSVVDIDELRQENAAYEYLCHLEEARLWIEECIQEHLPHSTELEARLRNGVYLAKLSNFIAPHVVPLKKIFDADQKVYISSGLHYRHTDNINYWISAMKAVGLPSYFYPNSFDVYGKKNMPKAVYCLHALNLYLHRCGKGMKIMDLIGKIHFSPEEICSVTTEFKKYGIQLPAFSKIGGILANEISPNDATLHAAIIAINIAICHQNSEHLFAALMNPNAELQNVFKGNAKDYQNALCGIKSKRALEMKLRNPNKFELCWDFLTYKIIQEEIDSVNLKNALIEIKNAALHHSTNDFMNILQQPLLSISDVILENANVYISNFKEALKSAETSLLNQTDLQSLVLSVNYSEQKTQEKNIALINLNNILMSDDYFVSFNILKSLSLGIHLHDFGRQFYHLQLENLKKMKERTLDIQDLQENLPILTALLDISMAIIQNSEDETFKALSNPVIKCWELHETLKKQYFNALNELKYKDDLHFLSTKQIKKCITDVNTEFNLQQNSMLSAKNINFALSSKDKCLFINSLLGDPSVLSVNLKHKNLYFNLLLKCKSENESDILSREEIQRQINLANKLVLKAEYYCACLASVNMAIDNNDATILCDSLKALFEGERLCTGCKENYLNELKLLKQEKYDKYVLEKDLSFYSWIKWEVSPEITFYLNLKTLETAWNEQENFPSLFLDKNEILNSVSEVQNVCKCYKYEVLKSFITSLQSHIRGCLVRRKFSQRMRISRSYTHVHAKAALKLQSFVRMSLVRKKYLKLKSEKLRLHAAARVIQKLWRAFKVNQNLNILAHSSNPPLALMQKIIYMLEISNDDYSEEFKLHTIKGKAVQTIRYNQALLKEIDEMDIKIGLLIRNRITLEDLLIQKKKNSVKVKKTEISAIDFKSLSSKLFSKKYNTLIEFYENLLYLIQTKPIYLAHLIVSLPTNQTTSLIESVIFSLYNFGSTPREEYLLLKMLSLTLEEEIKQKGDNLSDIIKGENIIMKIIISFYRKSYWHDCLKLLLKPLISEVLADKCTLNSTDPVEIYKVWQNELEMQTGEKSSLPHDVTVDDALGHLEVNNRFNQFIDNLLRYSLAFCEAIVNGQTLIPYGILYISKMLKRNLQEKYPSSSSEELNKIVGNFLYYRYINPVIIAPDVFNIMASQHSEHIADYKRLKLSAIAKFLHFSVTGKKYTEDTPHLMCLNPYLSDYHKKFMLFIEDVCKVNELEEHFNIDIFSEAIMQIPEIYMSLNELQTLHKLLIEKEYDLAPDSNDILHEILEDFNPNSFENIFDPSDEFLNTEICLSLKSKYDLDVEDETDEEKIYVETKFMLITLLQVFLNVTNITDLVEREPTLEEEMQFEKICFMKQRDADFSRDWIRKSRNWKTLPALQSALHFNLNSLELCGYVSSADNYQEILNNIAKDIVNRWRYRVSRKKEILKLIEVQKQLDSKTVFYLEKLDYYNKYIAVCLENMMVGKRNGKLFVCRNSTTGQLQNRKTIKLSGNKLYEKGILIEIKDLDTCQFKNVNFEISPAEDLGVFVIKAKFMSVPLETVDIDIQELLCMQYHGISEMNMFECVKVNNNLLLHFLNSKFYGKDKPKII